ncbi:hypothetical protein [Arthrobacter oryzae]|uniref:hypothetical protein n=1 Tax=Arthrobacter oryzae TaxID=409290 RepID=UPI0030C980B4
MANLTGDSADISVPAVKGTHSGTTGAAVEGESATGWGIHGHSVSGRGVVATSEADYGLRAHSKKSAGLRSSSEESRGLEGWSTKAEGVHGISETGNGVWGYTKGGTGVVGTSDAGPGVSGESANGEGVRGTSNNIHHGGVVGVNTAGGIAIYGTSDNSVGVFGTSVNNEGLHAETHSTVTAALAAYQRNANSPGAAIYAKHAGNRVAGFFEGDLVVTGDITLTNADCAEDFDVWAGASAEPGTVMALDDEGNLRESSLPYDKRVAGVVSGAGDYRPGLILDKQRGENGRKPIALLGKVFCKADARFGPICVGDLLTTSATPGHAMRADDPLRAFGSVIGKALRPLPDGQGLIPVLIALQ